jgi:hypothetical protein
VADTRHRAGASVVLAAVMGGGSGLDFLHMLSYAACHRW